jgi:hypothetical protein
VVYWLIAALLSTLGALAAARFMTSPGWVDALFITGGAAGLSVALALGLGLRRLLQERWMPWATLIVASAAALGRASLVTRLMLDVGAASRIHFPSMALACSTVVWGALALLWGTLSVSDTFDPDSRNNGWPSRVASVVAVVLALYSLAPMWHLLGIRVNHWTILGLFGLACLAYGIARIYRLVDEKIRSIN